MNRKILTATMYIFLLSLFCAHAEKIVFSADSMSGIVGDKSDSTTLEGEAYVLTESMEISADKITMYGEDFRYIEASGSVNGKNMESELEFTCGKIKYDRETKIALLSNGVNLKDIKNEVTVKGHLIEYNQNTDIAVMQIDIELLQKDNICTGVYAIYRKNEQMLELSGNAQIKQGDDTFRAQHITMNLDSQEIILDGRVKGSIIDERKNDEGNKSTAEDSEDTKPAENAGNAESPKNTENAETVKNESGEPGETVNPSENADEAESAHENEHKTESGKNEDAGNGNGENTRQDTSRLESQEDNALSDFSEKSGGDTEKNEEKPSGKTKKRNSRKK